GGRSRRMQPWNNFSQKRSGPGGAHSRGSVIARQSFSAASGPVESAPPVSSFESPHFRRGTGWSSALLQPGARAANGTAPLPRGEGGGSALLQPGDRGGRGTAPLPGGGGGRGSVKKNGGGGKKGEDATRTGAGGRVNRTGGSGPRREPPHFREGEGWSSALLQPRARAAKRIAPLPRGGGVECALL